MGQDLTLVYNEPQANVRYDSRDESAAVQGVMKEVNAVQAALIQNGYRVTRMGLRPPLSRVRKQLQAVAASRVFNLFEGFAGHPDTEAELAFLLEGLKLPYTGCPARVLKVALNKGLLRELLQKEGIPVPAGQVVRIESLDDYQFELPCIVKPVAEDASHGISEDSVVYDLHSLRTQVDHIARAFGGAALVETFIEGREFNVAVLGYDTPQVLPISEITFDLPAAKPEILTYDAKWNEESVFYLGTKHVCPAPIPESLADEISRLASKIFRLLGCRGCARIDFRQNLDGQVYVIDVNPNPDIAADSGVAKQLAAAGITYNEFIERLINERNDPV